MLFCFWFFHSYTCTNLHHERPLHNLHSRHTSDFLALTVNIDKMGHKLGWHYTALEHQGMQKQKQAAYSISKSRER